MNQSHRIRLINLLRGTLAQLEHEFNPNDPSITELKRSIVRALAELEISRESKSDGAAA